MGPVMWLFPIVAWKGVLKNQTTKSSTGLWSSFITIILRKPKARLSMPRGLSPKTFILSQAEEDSIFLILPEMSSPCGRINRIPYAISIAKRIWKLLHPTRQIADGLVNLWASRIGRKRGFTAIQEG